MFDTITRRPSDVATTNRVMTTVVAVLAHLAILAALIVVPVWLLHAGSSEESSGDCPRRCGPRLPPVPPPAKPAPVRIGGQIKAPALISRVDPIYPAIAQAAQVEGIVILEATVGETGQVESVKVLRSAGLLDAAAVEAVKQWRYSPLRLNDRPTSFVLTVTVQFHLGNRRT